MELSGHASQYSIYSTVIAFTVIAWTAVLIRLITRLAIVRQPGWDDAFISMAVVLSTVMGVSIWKQADYGMGLHLTTVSDGDVRTAFSWFWNFLWLYYGSLGCTKLSILLLYIRVFPQKHLLRATYILIAVVSVWSCWAVFSGIFTCVPVSRFWTAVGWNVKGCLPRKQLWYTNASFNIATDIATAILPLPVIASLEIPKRQKNILMCVFAIGIFTCLISVLRLVYIYPVTTYPDFTWHSPLPAIWSCVEANTAILCSCVPTFKGLVQRFFPKLLDSMRSYGNSKESGVSKGTDASYSSRGSVIKGHDIELSRHSRRSHSNDGQVDKYLRAFGTEKNKSMSTGWYGETIDEGDNESEEAIIEYVAMPGQRPRPSEDKNDRNIYVEVELEQVEQTRH